jgi:hypothetical protein
MDITNWYEICQKYQLWYCLSSEICQKYQLWYCLSRLRNLSEVSVMILFVLRNLSEVSVMILFVLRVMAFSQYIMPFEQVVRLWAFSDPAFVLSKFMLSFIFVIVCGLFECKRICAGLVDRLCIFVLPLEIQLSRGDRINCFYHAIILCLSQTRTGIYKMIFSERWLFVLLILLDFYTISVKLFF